MIENFEWIRSDSKLSAEFTVHLVQLMNLKYMTPDVFDLLKPILQLSLSSYLVIDLQPIFVNEGNLQIPTLIEILKVYE